MDVAKEPPHGGSRSPSREGAAGAAREVDLHSAMAQSEALELRQRLQARREGGWWHPMMLLEWGLVGFMWILVGIVKYGTNPRTRYDLCLEQDPPIADPARFVAVRKPRLSATCLRMNPA